MAPIHNNLNNLKDDAYTRCTGGKKVRRPRTANRFDPKYTKPKVKKPKVIIFWGGIAASGRRVHGFFDPRETVNSTTYCTMLKRKALKVLKEDNLILCHDLARPHISRMTSEYLAREGINTMTTPGSSPDGMPIENVFGIMKRRLEQVPTKTTEEVKAEVTKV